MCFVWVEGVGGTWGLVRSQAGDRGKRIHTISLSIQMTHAISIAGFRVPQIRSSAGGAGRGQGAARPLVRRAPGRGRVPVCCHVQQPLQALIGLVGRGGVRRGWERAGRAPKGHMRPPPCGAAAGGELKRESCRCTILIPPESHRQLDAGGSQSKPAAHPVSASFSPEPRRPTRCAPAGAPPMRPSARLVAERNPVRVLVCGSVCGDEPRAFNCPLL